MSEELRLERIIRDNINKMPSEPFICWQHTWWSRGAFLGLIEECEARLKESGFKRGRRLALIVPNSPALLATAVAVWRLDGTVVLLDYRAGYETLIKQLHMADVFAALVYKGIDDIAQLISEDGIPCSVTELDTICENIPCRPSSEEESEIAAIFFTSGITGEANAVPLTHKNLIACIDSCVEHFDFLTDNETVLNALPNSNVMGFLCGALLPLTMAMKQVILQTFMPVEITMNTIKQTGVTIIPAVPAMISFMTAFAAKDKFNAPNLKYVFYGNGILSHEAEERAQHLLNVKMLRGYGTTEASSVVSITQKPEDLVNGCSGKPISCITCEIRAEDGSPLPDGEVGHLWISGDSVAGSYYRNNELTAKRFVDGWFDTCDLARRDEEGCLYIAGRASDLIYVSGFYLYAHEVELAIEEHPAVREAAVVGVPRPIGGEIVKAFIILKDGVSVSQKELTNYCRKKLVYYKVPRIIEFVSEMPRSATGNILKRKLSEKQ